MDLEITTLAERPELAGSLWAMTDTWPEFMLQDMVGWSHYGQMVTAFPDFVLVATDPGGKLVARGFSVPFALAAEGRGGLPDRGWDQVLLWALSDHRHGTKPDVVSAIEISIHAEHQGKGLAAPMVKAMRDNAKARGFSELVAPVRPTAKHHEPATPMAEYAFRKRDDGLPFDPWLRTHVRLGGVIAAVAPASMVIAGSLADWRSWTGLPFDTDGWVEVPFALSPVHCVPAHDHAVYVEPNVWVRHPL